MTAKHEPSIRKPKPMWEKDKLLSYVSLTELTTPRTGLYVVCDRWWLMHPEHGGIFVNKIFPQHYTQRDICEFMVERLYPWAETHFIGIAYIPIKHQRK
jgi:hypothetical protein